MKTDEKTNQEKALEIKDVKLVSAMQYYKDMCNEDDFGFDYVEDAEQRQYVKADDFAVGQIYEGILLGIKVLPTKRDDGTPDIFGLIQMYDRLSDKEVIFGMSAMIREFIERTNITAGDPFRIKKTGIIKLKQGRTMNEFSLGTTKAAIEKGELRRNDENKITLQEFHDKKAQLESSNVKGLLPESN